MPLAPSTRTLLVAWCLLGACGCLGPDARLAPTSEPQILVTADLHLLNNGSKALSYAVNLTNASKTVIGSGSLGPGVGLGFSILLTSPGDHNVSVDWWVDGESVSAPAAGTLASDRFHADGSFRLDPADCRPGSAVRFDETAWYFNRTGPGSPLFAHGLQAKGHLELCEPAANA